MALKAAGYSPWAEMTSQWIQERARQNQESEILITSIDTADGPVAVTSVAEAAAVLKIHGPPLQKGDSRPIKSGVFEPINEHPVPDSHRPRDAQKHLMGAL
jgi:hypothetical protein